MGHIWVTEFDRTPRRNFVVEVNRDRELTYYAVASATRNATRWYSDLFDDELNYCKQMYVLYLF